MAQVHVRVIAVLEPIMKLHRQWRAQLTNISVMLYGVPSKQLIYQADQACMQKLGCS
jgi:hypothetical protein